MFLKRVLTILVSISRVHCNCSSILLNNPKITYATKLSQCVVDIIIENKFSKTTILSYENDGSEYYFHTSVLTEIVENVATNGIPIAYLDVNNINQTSHFYAENSIAITKIETCKSLFDVADIVSNHNYKYLIILNTIVMIECNDGLKDIASKIAEYHVTFVYEDKVRNVFKILTYVNIFCAETCELKSDIKIIDLNGCGSVSIVDVFPNNKPKDWMNCSVNVGLRSLFPYYKSYGKTLRNYDIIEVAVGVDPEILKIVAQYFNASLNFYYIDIDGENSHLNLSLVTFVTNSSLDVLAGGLYRVYVDADDIISYSGIYSRQKIVWIYTVERIKGSWLTFIKKTKEIYIFIIFFLLYTLFRNIFCYFDKDLVSFPNTFVYAWGTLFGAASLQHARTIKQKMLNLSYLVLSLHLYAYVTIELYPFLTIQGPPQQYKYIDELSESGRPVYLMDHAKYYVDDDMYVTFANKSRTCIDIDDCIVKMMNNKGSTAVVEGLLALVQVATAVNGEAKVLKATEPIVIIYHEMIIRKDSALLGRIESVIPRLLEAGICRKLYEDSIGILVLDKARSSNFNMMSNSYRCDGGCKITIYECVGAFYVWILGCVFSSCVFCLEIIIRKQNKDIK